MTDVSRILTTLKSRDYVRVRDDGRYDLGVRLFELGQVLRERMPFRRAIIPHVDALARETGETAFAVHYSQGEIAYLYDCVSAEEIRLGERAGMRCSPWNHVAGKVILSHREQASVRDALQVAEAVGVEPLPVWKDLQRELARIRRQGFATEREQDKSLVAAALKNSHDTVSAAFLVGGPSFRMKPATLKRLAPIVQKHCANASIALGWLCDDG